MTFGFGLGLNRGGGAGGLIPSFNVNFLGGALPQGATFSRGTIGTIYNQSGLVAYAPSNLLTYSTTFTPNWVLGAATVVAAPSVTAPDGTNTAYLLTATGANGYIYQTITPTLGLPYTLSVYVLATGTPSTLRLACNQLNGAGDVASVAFTTTGAWQRITLSIPSMTGTGPYWFALGGAGSFTTGEDLYIWGPQFEQSPTATTYQPTTTAAVYAPRFDYDPSTILQQNLFYYSNNFGNVYWTKANVTVGATNAPAPDGTNTATYLTNTNGSPSYMTQSGSFTYLPSTTYTRSFYARLIVPGGGLVVSEIGGGSIGTAIFGLVTGTAGAITGGGSSTITSAGGGWYFCTHTFTTGATSNTVTSSTNIYMNNYGASTASQTIALWNQQTNIGSTALPFLATTGASQTICPPKGLLIEEARTNVCTYSSDYTNAFWIQTGITITSNATTAPDGTATAQKIVEDTSTGTHKINGTLATVASTTYTMSCYLKAAEYTTVLMSMSDASTGDASALFTLTGSGSATAGSIPVGNWTAISYSIQVVANGWYRCVVTGTHGVGTATLPSIILYNGSTSYTGNGTNGVYAYGAQVEAGIFATSYIPTTSATVTRSQDNLSTPVGAWFNATAGTLVVQASPDEAPATEPIVRFAAALFDTVGYTNAIRLERLGGWRVVQTVAGTPAVASGTWTTGATGKLGAVYINAGSGASFNGASVVSIAGSIPTGITTLGIGGNGANGNSWCGHIQSFQYYNYALTNAQLQTITT